MKRETLERWIREGEEVRAKKKRKRKTKRRSEHTKDWMIPLLLIMILDEIERRL